MASRARSGGSRRGFPWLLAALLLCAWPSAARADNLEEFGFGARAQGMGGAFTSLSTDPTATYYNPAGLIFSRHFNLQAGFSFADYALSFDSQRGGARDSRAERIPDLSAYSLGISTTIPFDVPDRFGFGLAVFLPTRGLINLKARATTDSPEWFRYGNRHDRVHILAGAAVKVTEWLSLGLGAQVFVDAAGGTTISAGLNDPVTPTFELQLKPDASPIVGLMFSPSDWLSFGLTYRGEISFKLDFPAEAVVQGIRLPLTLETITFFTPHQLQLGASIALESWLFSCDLLYSHWSAYDDPFVVVTSAVAATTPRQKVDLDNVFSPKLGVEFQAADWLALRAGYSFRNSAVPDQDSVATNLAGGSKHVLSFGVGFSFGKPPEAVSDEAKQRKSAQNVDELTADASYDLDLFFQWHYHPEVSVTRPASDPIGSWDAGGSIFNLGFTFTARF